jgi:hypothetical protein
MPNTYELRGHVLRERQCFLRTYTCQREKHTAKYFIERGKVYFLHEDGEAGRCNFGIPFLHRSPTTAIEPLEEFYEGGNIDE